MKHFLLITLFASLILSCKKEITTDNPDSVFIENVKSSLKDSLSIDDYNNLDFDNFIITKLDSAERFFRIAFKNNSISENFVLIETVNNGKIKKGAIIKLKQKISEPDEKSTFNGDIAISFLNRKIKELSPILNGFIAKHHTVNGSPSAMVVPMLKEAIPDVVVTCYISSGGEYSYSNYSSLNGLLGGSDYPGNSGYYSSMDGGSGSSSNDHSNYSNAPNSSRSRSKREDEDNPILIDFEPVDDLSPININAFLKCFSNIPDNGAICSIEILSDIPVDSDPNKLLNWQTGSPGHTFLQIKKTNGNQSVMQNIGFYPAQGWKTLLSNAPVPGKFVDNGYHEFNAGLSMNITSDQLKNTLTHISYLSNFIKYDIDNYNCTDFALDVFNQSRISNPIEIPKYNVPGGMTINGTSTPEGVYNKLKIMKSTGIESANINIPGVKGFVSGSNGPCN